MTSVLVIDDDEDIRFILEVVLNQSPTYTCQTAKDRKSGEALAKSMQPDVILLDVILGPDRGEDVLKTFRTRPDTCHIPVIFLTGKSDPEEQNYLLGLGARGIITKPFDPEKLTDQLDRLLR
ncbi:MAG: response regulator [Fidelibacterota bacterium]